MAQTTSRKILRVEIASAESVLAVRSKYARQGQAESEAATAKAWFPSIESFAQVLSEKNRELLALIVDAKPQSLAELAEISGRAKPNLSRTLRTMERHGLVELHIGTGRAVRPHVRYQDIRLDLSVVEGDRSVRRSAA